MMLPGAYSADACDDARHFFGCTALEKFFEPAHRHYMDAGLSYIAALVQPDTDPRVAFDSGHRLNSYLSAGSRRWFRNRLSHKDPRMTELLTTLNDHLARCSRSIP
jgi:hypothetical protein